MERMEIDSNLSSLSNQERTKIEKIYDLINSYLSTEQDKEIICNLLIKEDKLDVLSSLSYISSEIDSDLLVLLVKHLMVS